MESILTNNFVLRYDEQRNVLEITTVHDGSPAKVPIRIRLDTLLEMEDSAEACRWLGETVLLLIPEMRKQLFKLEK